ncbi:serine/threonine-protein kinase [Desulfobotulus alkaliphilus]|uniref:Serine/threonine-protein kinase n=1 Tax=Desulfobotulus alkaliphilus TaxID=622671 RepID=A0A562RGG1_9BACT|nr:protein kinase [Desulfobotulus alkaliphilus]TWI68145.1 serine/threonine-protein kinase [Desulfobotulus alkaliphilus]
MRTIGKYQIAGELGRGGMGRVLRVRHPEIQRILAAKLFLPHPFLLSSVGEKRLLSMFMEEARKMAMLHHPNVAGVEDLHCGEISFYTMPCYSRSLGLIMGEHGDMEAPCRTLDPDTAIHYMKQLLRALHCLHFHGMIHRDIKPWNLLMDDEDRLILGDFGLSRLRRETTGTPENIKVGSPGYAPPEQERDADSADERSDMYAAGVVFCRMLTGHFPPEDPKEKILLPEPEELWKDFLKKCLAKNPDHRFDGAEQMLKALNDLALAWKDYRAKECAFPFSEEEISSHGLLRLRSHPLRTGVRGPLADMLEADPLFRPARSVYNDFIPGPEEDLIHDKNTGLLWERAGSPFPLNREGADKWIKMLNDRAAGQRRSWRLPTVPELFSLTRQPMTPEDFCRKSPLDPRQGWVWSSDGRSHISFWFVDLLRGFAAPMDKDGYCFVKGVSDHQKTR